MATGFPDIGEGTVFAGDFRVLHPLGQGGMGAVYVAEQRSTGKKRALKLMQPQLAADPTFRKRFEQEARVGSLIRSSHVVEVIGAGVDPQTSTPWLAMELLVGQDLGSYLHGRGALLPGEVQEIFGQLCHALAAAHDVPIVHRDLKPENVFLAESRVRGMPFMVKVLDFGIAKLVAEVQTSATAAIGTPLWMAPEQAEPGRSIVPATDVWALGLIAFHLLTGRLYWLGANRDLPSIHTLLKEIHLDPIVPAAARAEALGCAGRVPAGFDLWFARCVSRDPAARFPHAREAQAALDAILGAGASTSGTVVRQPLLGSAAGPASLQGSTQVAMPTPQHFTPVASMGTPFALAPGSGPLVAAPAPQTRKRRGGGGLWVAVGAVALLVAAGLGTTGLLLLRDGKPSGDDDRIIGPSAASRSPGSPAAPARAPSPSPADRAALDAISGSTTRIPGGTFRMGAVDGDADQRPVHDVTVDPFELDRTEVTVRAYRACVDGSKCTPPGTGSDCNWGVGGRDEHPVNCVDWHQAVEYCAWAAKRLPTEEEWELAARGTEGRRFPWGEADPQGRVCWKRFDMAWGKIEGTCPVGAYRMGDSPHAIEDMAGNVWEWTASPYCPYGGGGCGAPERATRGGSRGSTTASSVRATVRNGVAPSARNSQVGFRCARGS